MTVMGQEYLPGRVGTASGLTIGLAVTLGGLAAPLLGRIADLHGVQAAPLDARGRAGRRRAGDLTLPRDARLLQPTGRMTPWTPLTASGFEPARATRTSSVRMSSPSKSRWRSGSDGGGGPAISFVTTMRTPGNDEELVAGLLFAEGCSTKPRTSVPSTGRRIPESMRS